MLRFRLPKNRVLTGRQIPNFCRQSKAKFSVSLPPPSQKGPCSRLVSKNEVEVSAPGLISSISY
jgi:hypothetical protein